MAPGIYFFQDRSGPTIEPTLSRLDAEYATMIETFRADHAHHDYDRITLALRRALTIPLVEDERNSGGVEFSAQELHDRGWLRQYLRVALQREAILLRRLPDLQRVVEVRDGPKP